MHRILSSLTHLAPLLCTLLVASPGGAEEPRGVERRVLVPEVVTLPGGSFSMGADPGPNPVSPHLEDSAPVHEVTVSPFEIGRFEITNAQFATFARITGYLTDAERQGSCMGLGPDGSWGYHRSLTWRRFAGPGRENHPAVCLSWNDADAYLDWLSAVTGKAWRLPTEAEWEYAARGEEERRFPWGEAWRDDAANSASYWTGRTVHMGEPSESLTTRAREHGGILTLPVDSFAPNPFGLHDMAGSVVEWCADWFDPGYYAVSPHRDPSGPRRGRLAVLRGGGWSNAVEMLLSTSRGRGRPADSSVASGFRVARPLAKEVTAPRPDPAAEPVRSGEILGIEHRFPVPETVRIPAGSFAMGAPQHAPDPEGLNAGYLPVREVELDAYEMARYEVTNAQFSGFVEVTGHVTDAERSGESMGFNRQGEFGWQPGLTWRRLATPERVNHPVVAVSYHDAVAYARWLTAVTGETWRLPREAEWEHAARGPDNHLFPWGETWRHDAANTASYWAGRTVTAGTSGEVFRAAFAEHGPVLTLPVGSFSPNPYGLHDTCGNVLEWVEGWFRPRGQRHPEDPKGVLRGGGWQNSWELSTTVYRHRGGLAWTSTSAGFRLLRDLD